MNSLLLDRRVMRMLCHGPVKVDVVDLQSRPVLQMNVEGVGGRTTARENGPQLFVVILV